MSNAARTVFIVDDDPDFVDLLRQIFELEDTWKVIGTFPSLEGLLESFNADKPEETKAAVPDLMVVDIFSSRSPPTEIAPITGYHTALVLRDAGLNFGTLFISSMASPTLLSILRSQHPKGWSYLTKSALLTSEVILEAAEEALIK